MVPDEKNIGPNCRICTLIITLVLYKLLSTAYAQGVDASLCVHAVAESGLSDQKGAVRQTAWPPMFVLGVLSTVQSVLCRPLIFLGLPKMSVGTQTYLGCSFGPGLSTLACGRRNGVRPLKFHDYSRRDDGDDDREQTPRHTRNMNCMACNGKPCQYMPTEDRRIFSCDWPGCGKSFAWKGRLQRHARQHKGVGGFSNRGEVQECVDVVCPSQHQEGGHSPSVEPPPAMEQVEIIQQEMNSASLEQTSAAQTLGSSVTSYMYESSPMIFLSGGCSDKEALAAPNGRPDCSQSLFEPSPVIGETQSDEAPSTPCSEDKTPVELPVQNQHFPVFSRASNVAESEDAEVQAFWESIGISGVPDWMNPFATPIYQDDQHLRTQDCIDWMFPVAEPNPTVGEYQRSTPFVTTITLYSATERDMQAGYFYLSRMLSDYCHGVNPIPIQRDHGRVSRQCCSVCDVSATLQNMLPQRGPSL